jgi:hypothetical protein
MEMLRRYLILIAMLIFCLQFMGCSDDFDTVISTNQEQKPGITGSKYWNPKYGLTITSLPIEGWTMKGLGDDGQGQFLETLTFETGYYISSYLLILMEPVSADRFIDLGENGFVDPIAEASIPCIWVGIETWKGFTLDKRDIIFLLNDIAEIEKSDISIVTGLSVEEQKITGVSSLGTQLIYSYEGEKYFATTFFADVEKVVYISYLVPPSNFQKYYAIYNQIVKNTRLLTKGS